jgi:hypothetical protein
MVAAAKPNNEHYLPSIGIWTRTETAPPTAGNTLVGLWLEGGQKIGFFCAFFRNADGECVDPDEEDWVAITFHNRQGDMATFEDEEIPMPDYWADARWLIPGWGGE